MSASPRSPWSQIYANILGCSLLIILGILVYGNHLKNQFQFDSVHYLQIDQKFQHPEKLLTFDFLKSDYRSRSLLTITIAWNALLGKLNPYGYHLFNLTFHLFNSLLLFFIAGKTCLRFQLRRIGMAEREAHVLSLFAAALFLIHPLQTESVNDIMSRSEILSATFYLLGFFLFQIGLDGKVRPLVRYLIIPVAIITSVGLGFGVKQTLITLPAVMALYYLCGYAPESFPIKTLKRWKWFFVLAALVGFGLLMRKLLNDETFLIGPAAAEKLVGRKTYMLSQPSVLIFYYLKLIFFPFNLNVDPDIALVERLLSPRFLSAFSLIALIVYMAAVAKHSRIWFFFVCWFFIIISPSSSIITLNDLASEHRAYLASYGFYLLLTLGLMRMAAGISTGGTGNTRFMGCVALTVVLLSLCGMTVKRNSVWTSERSLWDDARKKSPAKARPWVNLARTYADDINKAIFYYEKSLALNSVFFVSHYNLGDLYYKTGRMDEALKHIQTAASLEPGIAEIQGRLGEIYMDLKQYELADNYFRKAVELNPQYVQGLRNMGVVNYYYLKDKKREALAYFSRALELDPNQPDAALIRRLLEQRQN